MNQFETEKVVMMLPPQLKDNGNFAGNTYIDTMGYHGRLRVEFHVGTTDAAIGSTDEATPPKLEECETSGGSYTAITDAALAAVIGAGDDNKIFAIDVDLRKTHKRYIEVTAPHAADGTTGANLCIVGRLSGPEKLPETAAEQGLEVLVSA